MPPASQPSFLIVGAGVYGASTALTLARLGYRSVTVLDRSSDGYAAPDAASHDLNKIIRADYSDDHYCSLGKEAISAWRNDPVISPYYHEVGVVFHSGRSALPLSEQQQPQAHTDTETETETEEERYSADALAYVQKGIANGSRQKDAGLERPKQGQPLPPSAWQFDDDARASLAFPAPLRSELGPGLKGFGTAQTGYVNPRGGWAEANNAVRAYLAEAERLGVKVVGKACVDSLLVDSTGSAAASAAAAASPSAGAQPSSTNRVTGVRCADGRTFSATHTILAVGSWSRLLLSRLVPLSPINDLPAASPSAQCVLTLPLSDHHRQLLQDAPVVLNFDTGFYVFEPTAEGVLKCAIHGAGGYQNPAPSYSADAAGGAILPPTFTAGLESAFTGASPRSPPSTLSKPTATAYIPPTQLAHMHAQLCTLYPFLAAVPLTHATTRICWYSDTHDENWLVDAVPHHTHLVVAGGDSGHAYKFLPTLGRLVLARLGVPGVPPLTAHQRRVFSFDHHARLARERAEGRRVESADSGRAGKGGGAVAQRVARVERNPRARL